MSTIPSNAYVPPFDQDSPTPYLRKDVIERRIVAQSYKDFVAQAMIFLSENPTFASSILMEETSSWAPPARY